MTTIDAAVKDWKKTSKEAQTVLENLERDAAELIEKVDAAHDAELLLEDSERGLENTGAEKAMVREAVQEADLLGDHARAEELKEEYRQLVEQERQLHEQVEHLTGVIENNRVESRDVAATRARLRRVNSGGSTLISAVREAVEADTTALRERVATVEEQLPLADPLDTLHALGFTEKANGYRDAIVQNESVAPGSGERVRERAQRELQSLLSKI